MEECYLIKTNSNSPPWQFFTFFKLYKWVPNRAKRHIFKELNQQTCVVLTTFDLGITLLCKTGTKTCRLFVSLPRLVLPDNQPLNFISLEYDNTVTLLICILFDI